MSKKEEEIEVILSSEMVTVVDSQKHSIQMVHEDLNGLITKANELEVSPSNEEAYESATELKRTIKATHIAIKKKAKELKAPILLINRTLDAFVKTIYDPLVEAEKLVKAKMNNWESGQDIIMEQKLDKARGELKERQDIDSKLHELNATLGRLNECKFKGGIEKIEKELDLIDLKSFDDRSDEAGFILGNLKTTCKMMKTALPEGEEVEKEPTVAQAVTEAIEIKTEMTERLSNGENLEDVAKDLDLKIVSPIPLEDFTEKKDIMKKDEPNKEEVIKEQPTVVSEPNEELDFGALADNQADLFSQSKEDEVVIEEAVEVEYFSINQVDEMLADSVLPMAVFEGEDEENVSKVLTISSTTKPEPSGLPSELEVTIMLSDGTAVFGKYELIETRHS